MGNISFTGSEENSAGPVYMDETDRQRHDEKREELDKFILELQMAVVSLIYTDLGLEGWSEGKFLALYDFFFFSSFASFFLQVLKLTSGCQLQLSGNQSGE